MSQNISHSTLLAGLPSTLRGELITEYQKIARNYVHRHWEATELDGGRFSEVSYSILKGFVDNNFPLRSSKPNNFFQSCIDLSQADKARFPHSVRIGIPRVLIGLYEIRNNRGVGHVGGDVDANHMDSTYVLHACQWVVAEFVRIFHSTDILTATAAVEAIVDRTLPFIWSVDGKQRILSTNLSLADKTLLILYSNPDSTNARSLASSLDQDRFPNFKRVLLKLHKDVLINYNPSTELALISPKGSILVEDKIIPSIQSI
ncbi:MAG TPA: hypothetical protein VGT61_15720 [Thermomicrobiales bacterium]|jgi:hypothetical protein|nr:hypothetical protein [Thermomicrobiales bacterium]